MSTRLQCGAHLPPGPCERETVRLEGSGTPLYGVCSDGHRTLVKCPGCMRRKFSPVGPGVRCVCALCVRAWRLESGSLVEDVVEAQRPTAAPRLTNAGVNANQEPNQPALEVIESTSHDAEGYRGGTHTRSLELVRPSRSRQPQRVGVPVMFASFAVIGLAIVLSALANFAWGPAAAAPALVFTIFLGVPALAAFAMLRSWSSVSVPERRVRIDHDRIEAKSGERWVSLANLDRVTEVVSDTDRERRRVLVRVEGAEPRVLLDELTSEEAEDARSRIEAQVRRAREAG